MSALCSQWCWTAYGCRGGCCSGCSRAAAWAQGTTSLQSKQCRLPTCNVTAAASELCMPWHSHSPPAGFPLRPVLAPAWRCCPAITCCQQAPMPLAGVLKARAGAACRRAASPVMQPGSAGPCCRSKHGQRLSWTSLPGQRSAFATAERAKVAARGADRDLPAPGTYELVSLQSRAILHLCTACSAQCASCSTHMLQASFDIEDDNATV